jgi:hypothetical protein
MGSNGHYPVETPVHRVTVSGFWIDRVAVVIPEGRSIDEAEALPSVGTINLKT